jgi:anti-sigma factor RsiW
MNWTCEQTEARLSDYIEGLLTGSERAAFAAHAGSCPRCAPLVSEVSQVVQNLHSMAEVEPSQRLVYKILDATLGPRESLTGWRAVLEWARGVTTARFIYGAVSVAATFVMLATASGFSWRKPKLSDLKPSNIYRNADRQAHIVYARGVKFVSDLRVVNEIQARFRESESVPPNSEDALPQTSPGKDRTDRTRPGPRQQNRADGVRREFERLADFSVLRSPLTAFPPLFSALSERRIR